MVPRLRRSFARSTEFAFLPAPEARHRLAHRVSAGCLIYKARSTGGAARVAYREALANVEIIIQESIETAKELGRPIPAPRGRLAFA